MGLWFIHYLTQALKSSTLTEEYTIYICPILNTQGRQYCHHRLSPTGEDYNRCWEETLFTPAHKKLCKDVSQSFTKQQIHAVFDIHSDEVSTKNYSIAPNILPFLRMLQYVYLNIRLKRIKLAFSWKKLFKAWLKSLPLFKASKQREKPPYTLVNYFSPTAKVALTIAICTHTPPSNMPRLTQNFVKVLEKAL